MSSKNKYNNIINFDYTSLYPNRVKIYSLKNIIRKVKINKIINLI